MITKTINIEGITQDTFEAQTILADGSIRGALYNADGSDRLESVVFVEHWPFKLTEAELNELKPQNDGLADS